ncbi:MAG: hypothetical protein EBZ48_09445 [Proteobacteria bacterium]|nr:hypothetical protein [Pseudomonadota bacterium]
MTRHRSKISIFQSLVVFMAILISLPCALAEDLTEPPFAPTWQLMNRLEKRQFIAGYLYAMKDAATMTQVLGDFIRENPKEAPASLDRLRGLYLGLAEGKAPTVVEGIDAFFKDPANRQAPLSRAITGVRGAPAP